MAAHEFTLVHFDEILDETNKAYFLLTKHDGNRWVPKSMSQQLSRNNKTIEVKTFIVKQWPDSTPIRPRFAPKSVSGIPEAYLLYDSRNTYYEERFNGHRNYCVPD